MKKLVTTAILALTSLAAYAGSGQVGLEYERQFLTGGSYAGVNALLNQAILYHSLLLILMN